MRAAIWLISLFALAVAGAWMAGNNPGTVSLFWPPYRVDLSLNLLLLAMALVVLVVVMAQRALAALLSLPRQAQRWRLQQRERAAHAALLDSISHFMAGRYLRARKSAEAVLEHEQRLSSSGEVLGHAQALRSVAHVMAAESAHALQDRTVRAAHLESAMQQARDAQGSMRASLTEGVQLRSARWLLDDRDAVGSLQQLQDLPPAVNRRMVAMRLQLKAARLAAQPAKALDTALLLAKHKAFTPAAAASLVRGLVLDWLSHVHDADAFMKLWQSLQPAQRLMPEVAAHAARRWVRLGGSAVQARQWLQPVWEQMLASPAQFMQMNLLVQTISGLGFDPHAPDAREWLARVESAQQSQPRHAPLQFLAGMACLRHQLWGKAQSHLAQAVKALDDPELRRQAWMALAELAEQRQEPEQALQCWKNAARS